jgi:choline dehydrogenase
VLLIEAGGEATSFLIQMPAGFARLLGDERFDWRYEQEPDPSIMGRKFIWSAGKLLGGGSSINGQVYIRGIRQDYDDWARAGNKGWSFAECFPYFLRAEHFSGPPSQSHGKTGPLSVSPMRDFHPLVQNFLSACAENGLPTLSDYCAGEMEGGFMSLATQKDGYRCSTEKAYLRDARKRPNLEVLTNAAVERILFDGKRAVGVEGTHNGEKFSRKTSGEILLCAGAIGSPYLLMKSGVGPAADLQKHGIPMIADKPKVGANLQEHVGVGISKEVNVPTYNSQVGPLDMLRHMISFLLFKKGPMGTPAVQAMALAKTRSDLDRPNVQLHFLPLSFDMEPETTSSASAAMAKEPTIMITGNLCRPQSRGRVTLGRDKDGKPSIVHELLGDKHDLADMVDVCKLIQRLFEAPTWRSIIVRDRRPQPIPTSDSDWASYLRAKSYICYHPCGTCAMGPEDDAVVDDTLRVKGLDGLRVIDASIIPRIPSANTNATVIMIAEKAADLIKTRAR